MVAAGSRCGMSDVNENANASKNVFHGQNVYSPPRVNVMQTRYINPTCTRSFGFWFWRLVLRPPYHYHYKHSVHCAHFLQLNRDGRSGIHHTTLGLVGFNGLSLQQNRIVSWMVETYQKVNQVDPQSKFNFNKEHPTLTLEDQTASPRYLLRYTYLLICTQLQDQRYRFFSAFATEHISTLCPKATATTALNSIQREKELIGSVQSRRFLYQLFSLLSRSNLHHQASSHFPKNRSRCLPPHLACRMVELLPQLPTAAAHHNLHVKSRLLIL